MTARVASVLLMLAFAYSPYSCAQTGQTVPMPGVSHEQVIQLELTPADFAAVATHRRVHTSGALRPEGGRYAPKTFETDSSGALVDVAGNPSLLPTGQASTASTSSGAPPFSGPGFYPADLSLLTTNGQTIIQAQVHNIYINCTAACWGYPAIFETNLFSSDFIHVADQYVGSEANGRYTLGPSLQISYTIKSQSGFTNMVNYADIDAILHAAALKFGSGYNHIYSIFLPEGVDFCNGYNPPYTSCFSPDKPASWALCGEHVTDSFADIPGTEYATVQPYPDVLEVTPFNGVPTPFYPCDVGQVYPFSSDTNPTPNGVLVDSVSNALGHELFETITDPDGTEWTTNSDLPLYTTGPWETGDLCSNRSFDYTPFYVSGRLYEIQPMYSNKYHACVTVP